MFFHFHDDISFFDFDRTITTLSLVCTSCRVRPGYCLFVRLDQEDRSSNLRIHTESGDQED